MDYSAIYKPTDASKLTLASVKYDKCLCDICTQRDTADEYDVLSSLLHPNIKAGFARYRDKKNGNVVGNIKLFPQEYMSVSQECNAEGEKENILSTLMVRCKTQMFSGNVDFMKNMLTSSQDNSNYNPFGYSHFTQLNPETRTNTVRGYNLLDNSTLECLSCKKITDTNSEDFMCLRVMDVRSKQVKNSCCVDLKKYGYSIISYVWSDVDEVCGTDDVGREYCGIDGELVSDSMQRLLKHAITSTCKFVWIDQICIDQTNMLDKELSVTHMDKAYSFCEMCILCLRKSTVESLAGYHLLQESSVDLSVPSNFTGNTDSRILAFLDYSIMLSFVNDPWFSRGWTLQEAVLPDKLVVATGHDMFFSLDWTLEHAQLWTGRISIDTNYVTKLFSVENSSAYVQSMLISLTNQLDGIFKGKKSMDWGSVAKIMSSRQTSVQLDQVFCLRGILPKSHTIKVDYSADITSVMKELSDIYPESSSSLFWDISSEKDYPSSWIQYKCLPPLIPIENPTSDKRYVGECTFIDISKDHVDGSIIRGCIEMARGNGLDINHILGDATYGILEIYPQYMDNTVRRIERDERGEVSGRASHLFLQLELYSRTWCTGSMMITPEGCALMAFTKWNIPYSTPHKIWMGDRRRFESANYVAPLFMFDDGFKYIGWSFCTDKV